MIESGGKARQVAAKLVNHLAALEDQELAYLKSTAELSIKEMGISFTVYNEEGAP